MMKKKLKEYIPLSEEEKQKIWKEGVFVLDANVLLNMCRYTKKSSDELLSIVKTHKDNIWLPYQVAMEFFNNRISVIEGIRNGFDILLANISKIDTILEKELKFSDFKSDTALNIGQLRKDISVFRKRTESKIKNWKKEFEDNDKEVILKEILNLYDSRVGDDYEPDRIESIYKEGEKRYKEKTPPGFADFEDKKKKGNRHLYGDLIWWKQAMDYAKANKTDLVIVTDDRKEDWWYKESGKTISPRVELIREFDKETNGRHFLMYQTHQFMEMAKDLDGAQVSDSSIREAEEMASVDYSYLKDLMETDIGSLSLASLQPNTITSNSQRRLAFDPFRFNLDRMPGEYDGASLQGLVRPYSPTSEEGVVVGQDLLDFFSRHPNGKMTYPAGTFEDASFGLVNGDDDKK